MTVQELIDELMLVENKDSELMQYCNNGKFKKIPQLWLRQKKYMYGDGTIRETVILMEGD